MVVDNSAFIAQIFRANNAEKLDSKLVDSAVVELEKTSFGLKSFQDGGFYPVLTDTNPRGSIIWFGNAFEGFVYLH